MQGKFFEMELFSREEVCLVEIRHSSPEGAWKVSKGMKKKVVEGRVDQTGQADHHHRDEQMR